MLTYVGGLSLARGIPLFSDSLARMLLALSNAVADLLGDVRALEGDVAALQGDAAELLGEMSDVKGLADSILAQLAAGPAAGGAVIAATGYAGLASAGIALTAAAWALAMVVDRRLRGTSGAAHPTDAPA